MKHPIMTSNRRSQYFDIAIYGRLWCGAMCNHSYRTNTKPADLNAAKALAVDFETVEQITVAEVITVSETNAQILMTEKDA